MPYGLGGTLSVKFGIYMHQMTIFRGVFVFTSYLLYLAIILPFTSNLFTNHLIFLDK